MGKWVTKSRVASASAVLLLALGVTLVAAQPASAGSCSSLTRSGSYIVGSCVGYPSFTISWDCYWSPQVNSRTFSTTSPQIGQSFRFHACDSGVYSVWVN